MPRVAPFVTLIVPVPLSPMVSSYKPVTFVFWPCMLSVPLL